MSCAIFLRCKKSRPFRFIMTTTKFGPAGFLCIGNLPHDCQRSARETSMLKAKASKPSHLGKRVENWTTTSHIYKSTLLTRPFYTFHVSVCLGFYFFRKSCSNRPCKFFPFASWPRRHSSREVVAVGDV